MTGEGALPRLDGLLETAAIRQGRPFLAGAFRAPPGGRPPFRLVLRLVDQAVDFGEVASEAPFVLHPSAPWEVQAGRSERQFVVIRDAGGAEYLLPAAARLLPLALNYRDRRMFFQHVQDPGRRLADKETLAFHARRYLDLHPPEKALQAAALTILAYRLLEAPEADAQAAEQLLARARPVLAELAPCDTEGRFRWCLSLTMACHYLCLQTGRPAAFLEPLRHVVARWEAVSLSPAQAGNALKAIFHLGSLLWRQGERAEAEAVFALSREVMRRAAPLWRLTSWHSANELVAAAQLLRACLTRLESLHFEAEGTWREPSYERPSREQATFACLGFPSAGLLRRGLV